VISNAQTIHFWIAMQTNDISDGMGENAFTSAYFITTEDRTPPLA
jgi:hypothetical protein